MIKNFLVFVLMSVVFGGGLYFCVKDDIDPMFTTIKRTKVEREMSLDYQAYTKEKEKEEEKKP